MFFAKHNIPRTFFYFFFKEPLPTHRSLGKSRRAPTRRPAVPAAPGTSHRRETALGFGRRGSCSGTVCGAWRRPHGPGPPPLPGGTGPGPRPHGRCPAHGRRGAAGRRAGAAASSGPFRALTQALWRHKTFIPLLDKLMSDLINKIRE